MLIQQTASRLATKLAKTLLGVASQRSKAILAERLPPIVTINTRLGAIQFYCPGKTPLRRAETLLLKEPETIEWIDAFGDGSVFWDIGANVGVYSLYAALKHDATVFAFEPAAVNYSVLAKNIEINKMDSNISALCIAFSNISCLNYLYMPNTKVRGSHHNFGEALDWQGKHFSATFKQAALSFSIDDFILQFDPSFPSHIKIDVDGIEDKIIEGARTTILDERLKSILVELNPERTERCRKVIDFLEGSGLQLRTRECGHKRRTGTVFLDV